MKVIDPVCGMSIESDKAQARETYHGRNYYFCSAQCQQSFQAEPAKFAVKAGPGGEDDHGGHRRD